MRHFLNRYDDHDKVDVTLEEYRKNLELIVAKLQETTATLLFVTTTEFSGNSTGIKVEDPAKYNLVAMGVMKKNGIEIFDLYNSSLTIHPQNFMPGNVHYTYEGCELLANPLIKAITAAFEN